MTGIPHELKTKEELILYITRLEIENDMLSKRVENALSFIQVLMLRRARRKDDPKEIDFSNSKSSL